ncbi:hypothetical protein [Sphingomonas sp. BK235]|uniref:hypothetical protein n=1 Tax=Sphingomonas sp. BK235 TaxID=2512131 RepID=UPI00104D55CB|nr:hypothetical protein [Sphingomonas sp. BK235]TCP34954.1 hypothetical protein EV292_103381 [Sphingomonas sp. BK235]
MTFFHAARRVPALPSPRGPDVTDRTAVPVTGRRFTPARTEKFAAAAAPSVASRPATVATIPFAIRLGLVYPTVMTRVERALPPSGALPDLAPTLGRSR